jgi:hypothetical protein
MTAVERAIYFVRALAVLNPAHETRGREIVLALKIEGVKP